MAVGRPRDQNALSFPAALIRIPLSDGNDVNTYSKIDGKRCSKPTSAQKEDKTKPKKPKKNFANKNSLYSYGYAPLPSFLPYPSSMER